MSPPRCGGGGYPVGIAAAADAAADDTAEIINNKPRCGVNKELAPPPPSLAGEGGGEAFIHNRDAERRDDLLLREQITYKINGNS